MSVNGALATCNITSNAKCQVSIFKDQDYMIRAANPPVMDSRSSKFYIEVDYDADSQIELGTVTYYVYYWYYILNARSELREFSSANSIQGLFNISTSSNIISNQGYFYLANGTQYNIASAPFIQSLNSNIGSRMGQILTITGAGFSTTAMQNTVSFNGLSCSMINSTSTQIICELPQDTVGIGSSQHT